MLVASHLSVFCLRSSQIFSQICQRWCFTLHQTSSSPSACISPYTFWFHSCLRSAMKSITHIFSWICRLLVSLRAITSVFPKCMFTSFWSLSSPSFQLNIRAISRFDPLCWEQFLEGLNSSGCCSEHFWPKYGDIVSFVCNSLAADRRRIAAVSAVSSGTVGRVQLRKSFHWRISLPFRVSKYFVTKPDPVPKNDLPQLLCSTSSNQPHCWDLPEQSTALILPA